MEDIKLGSTNSSVTVPTLEVALLTLEPSASNGGAETVPARPPPTPVKVVFKPSDTENFHCGSLGCVDGHRKRIKLGRLTAEEKLERKTARNRISSQRFRDRQKARTLQQDVQIKHLQQLVESAEKQVLELQSINEILCNKNVTLAQENASVAQLLQELKTTMLKFPTTQIRHFDQVSGVAQQEQLQDAYASTFPRLVSESATTVQIQQQQHSSHISLLDNVLSWDLDSPVTLQMLGEFSEQILVGDEDLGQELQRADEIAAQVLTSAPSQHQQPVAQVNFGYNETGNSANSGARLAGTIDKYSPVANGFHQSTKTLHENGQNRRYFKETLV